MTCCQGWPRRRRGAAPVAQRRDGCAGVRGLAPLGEGVTPVGGVGRLGPDRDPRARCRDLGPGLSVRGSRCGVQVWLARLRGADADWAEEASAVAWSGPYRWNALCALCHAPAGVDFP